MTGRKCVVCGRRIPRSNPYLKDEDTGRSYHKKCFQKEFGSLRGVGVVENPVKAGGDADTVSQILIAVGKFATSDEGKKVLSYATDKPLEALMEAAEQKELIPAGSAKKQAGAVRKLFGSVLTQEAAGIRTNIAPVVVGALQLAGALYTTKAGRTLIKASSPPFWAVKGVEVGSGIVGGALAKKGGAAGKVGKGLQTVSHGVKKAEEWEDKGMETVGKALTLQFNPARTVAKAGYRRVGKTPDNTTFYLRVVLDDGTDIPSLALFKHRVVVGTEAEIDDGYKAYVGKPIRALIDYIRTKPGEYILAEEFAAKLSNPENARERVHSLKLMEPVTRLISAWDKKDRVRMLEAEEEIYKITGMRKVIPFALTAEERHDPWLLARRISCVAQMKGRGDIYNPFALCRSAVRANPVDPRYKDIVAELIKKGYAVDTSDETQPDIYGVWTDLRFVDDPAYLRFLSDAEAQTLYEEVKKKHPAFVMPFRTWDREARAVVTAPRVVIGERDAEQNIEELKRLYVAGFDFTRYFHGTVGNLEIPGYWELEGHTGKYRQLDADSAAKVVAELTRAGFKTKVEKWTAVDVFDGGRYDAASVEILDTASMPFTLIENPMQCNPSSEDWTEAIAGEGWAIGDYTAMLEGATPEEAAVLEHIIVEEKEHLAELMALRGCKSNPAKLRPLTGEEIEKLASRKGVRRIAVENFLSTMGDNYEDATGNFYQDANSYGWNSATRKAISDGIYKAVANENPGVRENIKMNKSDYVFQLRAYHGYKAEDLEGKTLAEVKELFNRCYRARSNPGYGGRGHKLLTDELKRQLPPLYSQESVKDPTVWVKFFSPYSGWQWYITEGSEQDGDYLMFGFIHGFEDELGYVSFNELDTAYRGTLPLVERDLYWKPRPLSDVKKELGASNPLYMGDHYVLSCSCMPSRGQHWQRTADTVEEAEKIAAEHFASCSRAQDEGGVQVVRAGEWVPQANPRGLTSRVFGNLVAVYHVPGFLGPMVGLHMPPMEGFIGGWKKGNADYVLKRGPRGGWRWEHKSGDGRYIPLALDNGVDYSWQTDNRVLEAIHKYREEWNQRWGARHSVENPKMKMTDEDFAELDGAIQKLFQAYPDWMSRFPGLPERRIWAALYKAVEDSYYPRESMTRLYSYLNDAHIYTALQRIFDKWFSGGRANPITPMCQMAFDQLPQWVQKKLRTLEVSMPDALFKPCDVRVTWDNTDTEGRIHFLKSVGLIIKGRKNPRFGSERQMDQIAMYMEQARSMIVDSGEKAARDLDVTVSEAMGWARGVYDALPEKTKCDIEGAVNVEDGDQFFEHLTKILRVNGRWDLGTEGTLSMVWKRIHNRPALRESPGVEQFLNHLDIALKAWGSLAIPPEVLKRAEVLRRWASDIYDALPKTYKEQVARDTFYDVNDITRELNEEAVRGSIVSYIKTPVKDWLLDWNPDSLDYILSYWQSRHLGNKPGVPLKLLDNPGNPAFECQECGRKFHRSTVGFEVKCPKCGSYDVDIGYASNPKAKIVKKVASFDLDDYQLAERLKAMYPGEDRQAMYSRFVQERNLSPGIDARTFYAIYDSVTPDLHIIESDVEFTPTHINKITGFKTMFWDDAAGVHRFVDETGSTGSYPPRFDILESFDAINADPVERCVCIKEPRGDHGLEGYQLNETYYCQHVMKPGKKPYYRVWPEPFSRSDYETVGPNSFRKYFAPSVNGTVRSNPETSEAVRALPPLPRKTFALFPSERGKMCTHPLAHWNGKMPCTGEYVCSMCGSVLDPKTHKVIRVGTGSVEARKRENIGFRTVRGVRVGACPACRHKMKIDEAVLAMTPITTCSQCGEDVYFGYDDDETPRSNPLERPNANDGIRDMFYSMSFRGVVPDKDIQHILKSKRWERAYGKGAIADAWTVLVEGGLVERKGDNWHWVGYMSNPAENPAPNWEPGTALTYQGKKFWQPATFIRMVGADHAEVDLNEGRRIVHLSLLSARGSRNPVNEMQYCPRCEWTGTPQTDTDIHMPFECPRCGCMFHKQSTDIYLKSFDDPDTAREWAERNKVEVIDVSYIHDAAQYVLSYRGFPVEQERYDEPAENPRALLPVTVAMKDAMGY